MILRLNSLAITAYASKLSPIFMNLEASYIGRKAVVPVATAGKDG
jgi:hypothetical protein